MEWSRASLPTNALYHDELFIVRCLPTMPSFVRCLTAMPSCERASRRTLLANTPADDASDGRFRRNLRTDASDAAFGRTLPLDWRFLCAFRANASDVRRTVPANASGATSGTAFLPRSLHHPALTRLHACVRYAHSQISDLCLSLVCNACRACAAYNRTRTVTSAWLQCLHRLAVGCSHSAHGTVPASASCSGVRALACWAPRD